MYTEFCRAVDSDQYQVIIVDAVNSRISDLDLFYNKTAHTAPWTCYVIDVGGKSSNLVQNYSLRQNFKRSMDQIQALANEWEPTPAHMNTCKASFISKPDLNVASEAKTKVPLPASIREKLSFQIGRPPAKFPAVRATSIVPPVPSRINTVPTNNGQPPKANPAGAIRRLPGITTPIGSLVTMQSFTQRDDKKYKNQQNLYY